MNHQYKQLLVIGGTGMLRQACISLSAQSQKIYLISRSGEKQSRLIAECSKSCHVYGLEVDYTRRKSTELLLRKHLSNEKKFDAALLWLHQEGEWLTEFLIDYLSDQAKVVQLFGSDSLQSQGRIRQAADHFNQGSDIQYCQLVLGYKQMNDHEKRWLSHAEIAEAALQCFKSTECFRVEGRVDFDPNG